MHRQHRGEVLQQLVDCDGAIDGPAQIGQMIRYAELLGSANSGTQCRVVGRGSAHERNLGQSPGTSLIAGGWNHASGMPARRRRTIPQVSVAVRATRVRRVLPRSHAFESPKEETQPRPLARETPKSTPPRYQLRRDLGVVTQGNERMHSTGWG